VSDGTSEDVLAAADQNMLSAWRGVIAGSPAPGAVEDGDVVMLSSGVPVSLFNPAFVTGRPQAPAAMVTRVVDHYAELGLPFVLYFRDEITPELVDPCAAAGLVEHFRPPLMVLDPIPPAAPVPPPTELVVAPVDASNVDGYGTVLAAGFGIPRELVDLVLGPSLLDADGFTGFLGTIDGQPVGTSGLFLAHGLAGVYNVATVPEGRGKGVGAALTWAAALAGGAAGATRSMLQSSEQGEPVYRRMGYTTPTRYRQFEPPSA